MKRAVLSTHIPRTLRWGIILAVGTALISGLSIFVNAFAVKQLPDAAVYTTLKNGVAALLLFGIMAISVRPSTVRAVAPRSLGWLAVIGLIGGSLPFLLFFAGLSQASAPSAAFIHKTLFIWVALLAVPFLVSAVAVERFLDFFTRMKRQMVWITRTSSLRAMPTTSTSPARTAAAADRSAAEGRPVKLSEIPAD